MKNIRFRGALRKLGLSLLDLLFPRLCLHCHSHAIDGHRPLCPDCLHHLEFLDPAYHCQYCFSYLDSPVNPVCYDCRKLPSFLFRVGSVFEHQGPAATLVQKLKYGSLPHLAEGAAAFMAVQFHQLEWPLPDLIIPVPISWERKMERGYNQSVLLAEHLGEMLNRPVVHALGRAWGDFRQAQLTRKQRTALNEKQFHLKKDAQLCDQTVLLIDDVLTTGTTLGHCAKCLQGGYPGRIYGLTFCKAL